MVAIIIGYKSCSNPSIGFSKKITQYCDNLLIVSILILYLNVFKFKKIYKKKSTHKITLKLKSHKFIFVECIYSPLFT